MMRYRYGQIIWFWRLPLISRTSHAVRYLAVALLVVAPVARAAEPPANTTDTANLLPAEYRHAFIQRLSIADDKRDEYLAAIAHAKPEHREALAFLLVNMPERDLKSLSADFLLHDIQLAYEARAKTPWAANVPLEIFFDAVLPYASLNEKREDWRTQFNEKFSPLVKDCKTAGEAALLLNDQIFKQLNVKYHATKRPKPDQCPSESIDAGYASCTGLSIMLVDACRSVGIPARITGTPMWINNAGNHTWVEIWDRQWRFIGAAESSPFNQTWFADMASRADPSQPLHRIYSSTFRQGKVPFLMDWLPGNTEYPAVDVTGYYVARQKLNLSRSIASIVETVEVRQDGTLIAQSEKLPFQFELAADSGYLLTTFLPDGSKIDRSIRLARGADLSIDLSKTAATKPSLAITPAATLDLDGDWAKMKPIVPRGYVCKRASAPIVLDGNPNKPIWASVPWTEDFVDIEGGVKPAPRFRTRAKMLWDDENLYVLAELEEPHVWGTITKKNEVIFQDNDFEFFLSANGSNHHYHEFELNALNTLWELDLDKPYRNDGPIHSPSNIKGLRSAVHVNGSLNNPADTDQSWSVEIAFPWKELTPHAGGTGTAPQDGDQWRANFSRVEWLVDIIDGKYRKIPREMRPEDNWVWSPQGVVDMHRPERWGYLQFSSSPQTATFHPDLTLAARDALMTIYHRQSNFHKQFGKYAASPAELGLGCQNPSALETIDLTLTPDGYAATTHVIAPEGKLRMLHVRQDSKLWEDAGGERKVGLKTHAMDEK